ncbi:MAG: helix-turn-helix domain-containing protein [Candidatus Diapherotrites archaeon]|nr:helix-turn-helix domain-containing protein [Candidatus Diapherotrites archaeon]
MSTDEILRILRMHREGIWIRQLAREAHVSPATICNYLYGYKNSKGKFVKPILSKYVVIQKLGGGALTIIKLK